MDSKYSVLEGAARFRRAAAGPVGRISTEYRQAGLIPKDDFRVRAGDYEKGSSIIAGTGIGTPVRETGGLAACLTNRT